MGPAGKEQTHQMNRRGNFLLPLGFLVTLLAFFSYFFFFVRFPVTRDLPWVNLLLFGAGLALLGLGLRRAFRQPERYRGKVLGTALAVVSVLVFAFFLTYNFYLSAQLPASEGAPRVGQKAPDFNLPDVNGQPVTLSRLLAVPGEQRGPRTAQGRWVLLVFYRGYW